MAHKITDACVSCGTCAENCPVEAITQGDTQYEINPDTCVDCGACAANCPVDPSWPSKPYIGTKEAAARRSGAAASLHSHIKAGYYASRSSRRQSMAASWPRVAVWSAP